MGKKLYVGNIPYNITEGDLANRFGQFGTVESVRIIVDRETGRSKGFCFVEMANDDEALNAISQLNGAEMNGRPMTVNEARPMEQRPPRGDGPRGGGGGRGFGGGGGGGGRGFGGGGRGRD